MGPQPGNLIRNRVANANCLGTSCSGGGASCSDGIQNGTETGVDCGGSCAPCATCNDGVQNGSETGVDCGGPDCAPCNTTCNDNELTVRIVLDNYGSETTWTIKNSNGTTVASGGPYSNNTNGTVITVTECLADGCYDFQINDSYGDGICCSYGNGSYLLTDQNGNTLASGGNFSNSETKNFCLGGSAPTCTDGVQNGSETGVDCGGSDCAPCATCNDGVQNGSETGVDCGGPDCAPCATCNDGVQNGSETGVDCGGSDCAPCATCNDGVQNGDETGVDCGGSCAPCDNNTCTDVTLTLILDNYGSETTWAIKNVSGSTIASGGPYSNGTNGTVVSQTVCLPDACYDFMINDTYGDGICCSYGSGSYLLADADGNTLAEGGNFGSSQVTNFCIGDGTPQATCNDGIQNGSETGIDCGGPDCAPCDTSTDCITDENDFETGLGIWNDGGSDCARVLSSYANSGSYAVRLRDNTSSSTLTTDNLQLAGSSAVSVEFSYMAVSMDNSNEDFWLQVSTDGGASYTTVEEWNRGDEFNNNQRKYETVIVPGPFSNNTRLRFRCDASSNSDYVYLDDIKISNCGYNNMPTAGLETFDQANSAEILNLYPNPTAAQFTVDFNLAKAEDIQIALTDFTGKTVQVHQVEAQAGQQKFLMDASELASGFYFVQLITKDKTVSKKVVVSR